MAFRGRGRGFTPRGRGRGGRGFHQQYDQGPPEFVVGACMCHYPACLFLCCRSQTRGVRTRMPLYCVYTVPRTAPRAELGHFLHPCEGDLVCRCTNEKIPYFNAPVYLENKSQIGKVDDIFGPMNEFVSCTAALLNYL